MPFYPSPGKDDGYDISDFYGVDPRLGDLGHFVELMRTAKDRGMRVIVDLVVNHTSDQHPWFRAAVNRPNSEYRDYYVWRDEPPKKQQALVFPGEETSVWNSTSRRAASTTCTRFYRYQPDLNITNPQVRDEIAQIMGFWLELGDLRIPGGRGAVPHRPARRACAATRTTTCRTCGGSCSAARATPSCSAR